MTISGESAQHFLDITTCCFVITRPLALLEVGFLFRDMVLAILCFLLLYNMPMVSKYGHVSHRPLISLHYVSDGIIGVRSSVRTL